MQGNQAFLFLKSITHWVKERNTKIPAPPLHRVQRGGEGSSVRGYKSLSRQRLISKLGGAPLHH